MEVAFGFYLIGIMNLFRQGAFLKDGNPPEATNFRREVLNCFNSILKNAQKIKVHNSPLHHALAEKLPEFVQNDQAEILLTGLDPRKAKHSHLSFGTSTFC